MGEWGVCFDASGLTRLGRIAGNVRIESSLGGFTPLSGMTYRNLREGGWWGMMGEGVPPQSACNK